MKIKREKGLRTWIEIDQKAVKHNFGLFRKMIKPETKLMAVIKSNAYGHSLVDFAHEMVKNGADFLGVDSVVEGLTLRREGIKKPILILGYTLPERLNDAAQANLSVSVSALEHIDALEKIKSKKKIKIHIKIDSGMHRQGFLIQNQKTLIAKIKNQKSKFEVEGLFTHFAAAKNPAFPAHTMRQFENFKKWMTAFKDAGFNPINHAAATSGTILFPETHLDMVRVGIGLYGLWPASEVEAFVKDRLPLKPVLSWRTVIGEVKKVSAGSKVGYDFTETLEHESVLAVCPVGYWHGLPRALSSVGRVLVNGVRARVVGRVSMDMIIVDVSKCGNVCSGDVVTLIGSDGSQSVGAPEVGSLADTSHYEIVTRLNPLIRRLYL